MKRQTLTSIIVVTAVGATSSRHTEYIYGIRGTAEKRLSIENVYSIRLTKSALSLSLSLSPPPAHTHSLSYYYPTIFR
jgi:hypothetical protein